MLKGPPFESSNITQQWNGFQIDNSDAYFQKNFCKILQLLCVRMPNKNEYDPCHFLPIWQKNTRPILGKIAIGEENYN